MSLEELGRPRIDVVVNCSGVFRDLFVNQMNLLDRAIKLAAEQDEPPEMNFVRKHALEHAEELGVSANGRGYWEAQPEQLERLRQMYMDVEDKIEGVE
ncbi:hypothetical protein CHLNCDRAFT_143921 [Chlorella variabilis]|uniref:CobN/magnesium chelatase domain-containing protein n=1 Tax=Chlorella variabilis TaxID=554065 RepID=E1ZAR1_CHLVA|nr:hypothetical protein CHLNCDRAFT_143921 [Chlorella variabilis]EFN57307.1 hypothetical protein CHLNCDRAFT_143921 [Chlorella variabilis]|eukprot:XP_005849409.1 hypothetical protein CHLNCDRAFT_143921 [Chlorella variabilis]